MAQQPEQPAPESPLKGPKTRQMARAQLMGRGVHETTTGVAVHIYQRDGKYLARGRHQGSAFGRTLGCDERAAEAELRRLLVELENGSFVRPSERRKRPLKTGPTPKLSFRELVDALIAEKRALKGQDTARTYLNRLTRVIEFLEHPERRPRWPYVSDLDSDRAFAIELRAWLFEQRVARNGHPCAEQRRISARQVYEILSCTAMALNWASHPTVNLLPSHFVSPLTREIIGQRPSKDPLRAIPLPMELRRELVGVMDPWQLGVFTLPLLLPNRPEEFAGVLIDDVDFAARELIFATRFGGDDFTKAHTTFRVPLPEPILPILRALIGQRAAGPLLLRRTLIEGRRRPRFRPCSAEHLRARFHEMIAARPPTQVQNENDRKRVFRRLLLDMGGVDGDDLSEEFKGLLKQVRPDASARFYDTRGSISTEMRLAGVDYNLRRYITGRSLAGDTMNDYEPMNLHEEMQPYFQRIEPLIEAIVQRATALGVIEP